jgi:hypothetical protein
MFCEDFESGALDPATWSTKTSRASVMVDGTRAARGTRALHVRITDYASDVGNLAQIVMKRTFPVAGKHLYVRAFIYLGPEMPDRHFSVIPADGIEPLAGGGFLGYVVNLVPYPTRPGRPLLFRYLWNHGTAEPAEKYGTDAAPVGRWQCWEWEIRGATNELAFALDDKPLPSFTVTSAMGWTAPQNARFSFGWRSHHPEPNHPNGFEIWIDELAIADQKIGCSN